MRICDVNDLNSKCTMGCNADDQSPTETLPHDNDVIPSYNGPSRGDVPLSEMGPRRGKRDVSRVGPASSGAYPSTGGQLRLLSEQLGKL